MSTKQVLAIIVIIAIAALAVFAAYQRIVPPQTPSVVVETGPSIIGGLVGIATTTITVKSADGTQLDFAFSSKTPVISRVHEGEVGKVVSQLSIGDVLAVTADAYGTTAQKIEVLPISESPSAGGQPPFIMTGILVSASTTSVVVKPLNQDPATAMTNPVRMVQITKSTEILTQVLGTQTGKSLSAALPGAMLTVMGTSTEKGIIAKTILLLIPKQ